MGRRADALSEHDAVGYVAVDKQKRPGRIDRGVFHLAAFRLRRRSPAGVTCKPVFRYSTNLSI